MGHSERIVRELVEKQTELTLIPNTSVTEIPPDGVRYQAANGTADTVSADHIVFSGGKPPNTDKCFRFAGLTPHFFHISDSNVENAEFYKTHEMKLAPPLPSRETSATQYSPAIWPEFTSNI